MSVDRSAEDEWFKAKVMLVYRLSHGGRYYTGDLLRDEQESPGEIYRTIDKYEVHIEDPSLVNGPKVNP